jgi:hypothetical protein
VANVTFQATISWVRQTTKANICRALSPFRSFFEKPQSANAEISLLS